LSHPGPQGPLTKEKEKLGKHEKGKP